MCPLRSITNFLTSYTVGYTVLLFTHCRLQRWYGLAGVVLRWVESYLHHLKQSGVVFKRNDFTNVQPIGHIINKRNLKYNQYANDLQLLSHFDLNVNSMSTAVHRVEQCIDEIKDWMTYYSFVNDSKTEILPIIPKLASGKVAGLHVRVGFDEFSVSECVRKVGVYLDKHLDLTAQISRTKTTVHCIYVKSAKFTVTCHSRQQNVLLMPRLPHDFTIVTRFCLELLPTKSADCSDLRMLPLVL